MRLAEQLADEQNRLQQHAQLFLGRCYFEQAIIQKNWERYFDWKKQKIQGDLFGTQEGTQKEKTVIDDITTILAVLNISPMELGSIPLAHYTSPSVCERLFGIVSDKADDKVPVLERYRHRQTGRPARTGQRGRWRSLRLGLF